MSAPPAWHDPLFTARRNARRHLEELVTEFRHFDICASRQHAHTYHNDTRAMQNGLPRATDVETRVEVASRSRRGQTPPSGELCGMSPSFILPFPTHSPPASNDWPPTTTLDFSTARKPDPCFWMTAARASSHAPSGPVAAMSPPAADAYTSRRHTVQPIAYSSKQCNSSPSQLHTSHPAIPRRPQVDRPSMPYVLLPAHQLLRSLCRDAIRILVKFSSTNSPKRAVEKNAHWKQALMEASTGSSGLRREQSLAIRSTVNGSLFERFDSGGASLFAPSSAACTSVGVIAHGAPCNVCHACTPYKLLARAVPEYEPAHAARKDKTRFGCAGHRSESGTPRRSQKT
ncbi:hypothetical protein FPV67DRAFT_1669766 [Lyophyllum atratum]|nr:hypothetical protein FPV67DRAFT_1669766 [Lyophyllum atratum]